jgi:flavodoxin
MKASVYYVAQNPNSSSAQIVKRMKERLLFPIAAVNLVASERNEGELEEADVALFITATYGDQELQDDMERFLVSTRISASVRYVICEIGNYYGYDDYRFGSGDLTDRILAAKGARRQMSVASIDSLPKLDWKGIDQWIDLLNEEFHAQQ